RPGQLAMQIEYGLTLLRLPDAKGHAVLAEAAEQLERLRDAPAPPAASVQRLLAYLLTAPSLPKPPPIASVRELRARWVPARPRLLWRLAEHDFQAGEHRRAAETLERLVTLGRTGLYDRSEPFNPSLVGESALLNLGACYLKLRDFARAEACFVQLLSSP